MYVYSSECAYTYCMCMYVEYMYVCMYVYVDTYVCTNTWTAYCRVHCNQTLLYHVRLSIAPNCRTRTVSGPQCNISFVW